MQPDEAHGAAAWYKSLFSAVLACSDEEDHLTFAVSVAVALVADAVHHGALAHPAPVRVLAGGHVGGLVAPAPAVPVQALVRLDI